VACNLSIRYTERLAEAGIERSVGTVGDSYDNALAETIIGLYKTEVIRRRGPWRHIDAVEFATLSWVDWFNNRRLLEPLGYLPPAEFEAAYYRCQSTPAMVAGPMQSSLRRSRGDSMRYMHPSPAARQDAIALLNRREARPILEKSWRRRPPILQIL
jgi:hypothetical protein